MTEQELVKECLHDICKKNGFTDTSTMIQRDFELISRAIEDKTGILISVSTIKRLLNGDFTRIPQIATLNAISNYLGFKNWQEYKTMPVQQEQVPLSTAPTTEIPLKKGRGAHRSTIKWIGSVAIAIVIIAFFTFSWRKSRSGVHYTKASFSAKKTTDNALPNTVIFSYNVDDVEADSFIIQQSWDVNRRIRVAKNSHTVTDIYYEPGYHTAKLIANDSVIKTFDVSIPTDRWFFFAKDFNPKSIPEYIRTKDTITNGALTLNKKDLDSNRVGVDQDKAFIYNYFPQKLDVSSDNYTLKARVRVKEIKNTFCPFMMWEVYCQKNFMFFTNTSPGCVSEAKAQFGENFVSGKNADLTSFGVDMFQWMELSLTVRDRKVEIFLNNKHIFSSSFKNSSGLITGLGFISNGLCEVDAVTLKGLDGKMVYQDDFDK